MHFKFSGPNHKQEPPITVCNWDVNQSTYQRHLTSLIFWRLLNSTGKKVVQTKSSLCPLNVMSYQTNNFYLNNYVPDRTSGAAVVWSVIFYFITNEIDVLVISDVRSSGILHPQTSYVMAFVWIRELVIDGPTKVLSGQKFLLSHLKH